MNIFNKSIEINKDNITDSDKYITIEAIVSSTKKDKDNDIITSKEAYNINKTTPIYLNHNTYNLDNLVGKFEEYEFKTKNNVDYLIMKGKILKTEKNNSHLIPMLTEGLINQFSIGFSSKDYKKNEFGGYTFNSIEIKEVSIVGFPANDDTTLINVKNTIKQKENTMENNNINDDIVKLVDTKLNNVVKKEDLDSVLKEQSKNLDIALKEQSKALQGEILNGITSMQSKSVSKDDMFIKALTETDTIERRKSLNSFVNSDGGFLIPTGFSNEIQRNIFNETGSIRSLATTKFVNEKSVSYPVQTQAPKARWYSEGASTGLTNAKFSNLMIDVRKISAGTDSTWEGLNYQDSYTRQSIITDLKEAIKIRLDYDMLWGSASIGGVGGILTNANLSTGNLVEKITTATSGVADFKDFNRMFGKTKIQFADNMDTIIMHRETFYALMNQTSTTKEPIYKVFEDYQAGVLVRRFMNKNVVLVGDYIREKDDLTQEIIGMLDKPNDDGTFAGNSNIAIYGDFKAGYRFHVKKDMFLLEDDSNYPKSLNLAWYLHAFIGGNVIQPQALKVLVAK